MWEKRWLKQFYEGKSGFAKQRGSGRGAKTLGLKSKPLSKKKN